MTSILTTAVSPAGPVMVRKAGRAGADSGSASPAFVVEVSAAPAVVPEASAGASEAATSLVPRSAPPPLSPSVMAVMLQVQERLVEREGPSQARAIAGRAVDRALEAAGYGGRDNPVRLLNDCLAQTLTA